MRSGTPTRWSRRIGILVLGLIITGLLARFGQAPGVFAGLALTALALVLFEWWVRRSASTLRTGADFQGTLIGASAAAPEAAGTNSADLAGLREEVRGVAESVHQLSRSLSSTEEHLLAELRQMPVAIAHRLNERSSFTAASSRTDDPRAWSGPPLAPSSPAAAATFGTAGSRLPHGLVAVWDHYLREGDGCFEARGLDLSLKTLGVAAHAVPGEDLGLGAGYLGVVATPGADTVFLLPSFKLPAHTLAAWFSSPGHGSRQALISRLLRPATARRTDGRLNLVEMGEVE